MAGLEVTRRGLVTGAGATVGLVTATNSLIGPAQAASVIEDAFNTFVDQIGAGQFPVPPNSNTLDGHVPNLSGLARDSLGIINQLQGDNSLDGGDSADRTGVAAFCNSVEDKNLLRLFENNGIMVRHPTQSPWNNWKNCTRDQLIGYTSGCLQRSSILTQLQPP
jgi:hypothetical protein